MLSRKEALYLALPVCSLLFTSIGLHRGFPCFWTVSSAQAGNAEVSMNAGSQSAPKQEACYEGPIAETDPRLMNTEIHLAAGLNRDATLCRKLLDKAEDPQVLLNARNSGDETPLITATRFDNVDCVLVLLEYGASVDVVDDFGRTPLSWAASHGNVYVVRRILKTPGGHETVNLRDKNLVTPVFGAAERG